MYSSDVESVGVVVRHDVHTTTTDDEFYNELMDAPSEFEDHLIPDKCTQEIKGLEHLTQCLNHRFNAYPFVFMGRLKQAVQEAFTPKDITERRPLLIYINHDTAVYSNLFCKQLLCNEQVIDYLLNNYVFWAWDVTFKSNEDMLNEICETVFAPWTDERKFIANSVEKYPLLVGVCRDANGSYTFDALVKGSDSKFTLHEFLLCLKQFKEKFVSNEQKYEKFKEEIQKQMLLSIFQKRQGKRFNTRQFNRSKSMFPDENYGIYSNKRHMPFARTLSHDADYTDPNFDPTELTGSSAAVIDRACEALKKAQMNSDDDEVDADDEDDDMTPTVERQRPKFP